MKEKLEEIGLNPLAIEKVLERMRVSGRRAYRFKYDHRGHQKRTCKRYREDLTGQFVDDNQKIPKVVSSRQRKSPPIYHTPGREVKNPRDYRDGF